MADYIFQLPEGTTGNTFDAHITKKFQSYNGTVTNAEEYKTNPVFFFSQGAFGMHNLYARCMATSVTTNPNPTYENRIALSIERMEQVGFIRIFNGLTTAYENGGTFSGKEGGSNHPDFEPTGNFSNQSQVPTGGYGSWTSYQYYDIYEWLLCTNIPIFETNTEAFNYIRGDSNLHRAINYDYPREQEGKDFLINNIWTSGTWSASGLSNMGTPKYRLVKGRLLEGGLISFYKKPGIVDGSLQYGIKIDGELDGLQYSEDGVVWHDSVAFPYSFFYRERTDEIGTFNFALTFFSQIPVWDSEEDADEYMAGNKTIEEASNWPQISGTYPPTNNTGSALAASTFGEVKVKGFFSQQYICDADCLTAIANDMFDTSQGGVWEAMKKGLDAYGDSPIESVMGLSFWPFSVADALSQGSAVAASYIWFGGYGWATAGHGTCSRIMYANGYKSVGQLLIQPTFNSWRDYEPYSKLYVSLPYCGTYQLDIARYINKIVEVRYYFDTRTNGCIACLIVKDDQNHNGYLMDYFNGQMGVTMPITMTDYSAYMNAQMQVLLQGGGQAAQGFGNAFGNASGLAAQGGLGGLAGGLIAGGVPAAISGAATGMKTVYGLSQNNINNFNKTKGGSSSMINCYLPQTVDFIFEIQESCEPSNYNEMFGQPSLAAGMVANFSGFLKCQSVKLNCGIATERERERLKQMLLSGIYI